MLVFLVPLQSPHASRDWGKVSALCRRTIQSAASQDSEEFRICLIGNELPSGFKPLEKLRFIRISRATPECNTKSRMTDKFTKLAYGLVAMRDFAPCHFMMLDADDLVSCRLARFCAQKPHDDGWFFESGYIHDWGSRLVFFVRHGYHRRGAGAILRLDKEDIPADPVLCLKQCLLVTHGHTVVVEGARKMGRFLEPLPFPGYFYCVGTGENNSGFSLRAWRSKRVFLEKLISYRPLTPALRREFCVTPLC